MTTNHPDPIEQTVDPVERDQVEPPDSVPDQGDPELSAPRDGRTDSVAADESDA